MSLNLIFILSVYFSWTCTFHLICFRPRSWLKSLFYVLLEFFAVLSVFFFVVYGLPWIFSLFLICFLFWNIMLILKLLSFKIKISENKYFWIDFLKYFILFNREKGIKIMIFVSKGNVIEIRYFLFLIWKFGKFRLTQGLSQNSALFLISWLIHFFKFAFWKIINKKILL